MGKYTFEVGGRGKKQQQIKDVQDGYVAADDIEIGHGRKIPLWLFGFLLMRWWIPFKFIGSSFFLRFYPGKTP